MHPLGMPMEFLWRCWRPYCTFIVTLLPFYHMYSKCTARKSILFVIKPQDNPTTCTSSEDATELSQWCTRLYSEHLGILSRGIYIGGGDHQADSYLCQFQLLFINNTLRAPYCTDITPYLRMTMSRWIASTDFWVIAGSIDV